MTLNSRQSSQRSAEQRAAVAPVSAAQPTLHHTCAGLGNKAVAHICYDCATCLCVDDKLIKMPKFALANLLWLGREHPLLQNATTGLRLLLGLVLVLESSCLEEAGLKTDSTALQVNI